MAGLRASLYATACNAQVCACGSLHACTLARLPPQLTLETLRTTPRSPTQPLPILPHLIPPHLTHHPTPFHPTSRHLIPLPSRPIPSSPACHTTPPHPAPRVLSSYLNPCHVPSRSIPSHLASPTHPTLPSPTPPHPTPPHPLPSHPDPHMRFAAVTMAPVVVRERDSWLEGRDEPRGLDWAAARSRCRYGIIEWRRHARTCTAIHSPLLYHEGADVTLHAPVSPAQRWQPRQYALWSAS